MRHGLVSQKYILPWDKHLTIHSKSQQSLKSTKTNIISNIFLPYENSDGSTTVPKFILIEDAPGMGKTTLCKEIAYRWAKQSLLEDTKLVFLVYLRDPDIIRIKSLTDLVHYLYNFDESAAELSKQCAQALITRDNSDVMIMLDGYDEFNSSEHLLITDIMSRKVLPQSRIVVTSRLTTSDKLHRMADVRVEVLGFTNESKAEYIKEELKGFPDKIKKLQYYLDTHAAIKSICYMPIMMTILVYVFKEKEELPNDYTELYHKFLALTISHHLQKQNKTEDLFITLHSLPTDHRNYLLDLSKFAFLTLKSNKTVFTNEDITNICPNSILANTSLENFGLVVSVQYFSTDKGNSCVFNFLHLSIHEYLSAYYVSSIDQCKQFNELEATFLNERYKETWSTFVAINKKHCLIFQNCLVYCRGKFYEKLSSCIADINYSSVVQSFIQLSINIIHSNTITSNHIQLLLKKNAKFMYVHHWQFYLSFCSTRFDFSKILEMFLLDNDLLRDWNKLRDEVEWYKTLACILIDNDKNLFGFKINQQQLTKCFKMNISFYSVSLRDCYITNSTIDAIRSHPSNVCDLTHVTLDYCTFEQGGFTRLLTMLSNITTLRYLKIFNNNFTEEDIDGLILIVLNNSKLEELYLRNKNFEEGVTKLANKSQYTLQNLLQDSNLDKNPIIDEASSTLDKVTLSKCNFGNKIQEGSIKSPQNLKKFWMYQNNLLSSAIAFFQSLSTISTIKAIDIHNNHLTEEVSKAFASVLLHNRGLVRLHLSNNIVVGNGMLVIIKVLKHITSFRLICLGNNNISTEVAHELAFTIQANKHLEELHLYNANLKSSAIVILQSLHNISTLRILNINDNNIPPEAGEALASVILHNTKLQELHLRNNNLGEEVVKVAQALQHISSLRKLNISKIAISEKVSSEIALAIKSNKYLEELWLQDNDLKSSAIPILQSLSNTATLKCLSIDNNQINGEVIASVIFHSRGLQKLCLSGNNLGEEMIIVAKALRSIAFLRSIDLGNNDLSKVSGELAFAIKSHKYLEELLLYNSNLKSSMIAIFQTLNTMSSLICLNINDNQITEEAGEVLASVILHNTRLEKLYLRNNNFGKGMLEVAKALQHITSLKSLNLCNNGISNEVSVELAIAFKLNKHLEKLWMLNCNLKSSATVILQSLTTISTLKCLSIGNNQITQEAVEILASVILHNTELQELYLYDNNIGEGRINVLKALQCIKSLRVLSLNNGNILKDASNELQLALTIKSNRQLEELYLEELYLRNNDHRTGMLEVAKSLQNITSLKILNLGNNKMSNEACIEIANACKLNINFEKLWLHNNNLKSSAIAIIQSLSTISTLKFLNINNNQITEEAGEALASVILHNMELEELHLSGNNLGEGMLIVAKALQQISSLKSLDLGYNNISKEVSDELALAIKANEQLKKIGLYSTNLKSSSVVILQSLSNISTLKYLNINNNQITEEAGEALASVIMCNTGLQELYLRNNNLGKGMLKVAKALQHITSLKLLNLGDNCISNEVSKELAVALKSSQNLEKLWLYDCNLKLSAIDILQSLSTISTLHLLNMNDSQITEEAGEALASVILHNMELEELHLSGNNLGEGMLIVTKALQQILSLKSLDLGYNNISKEVSDELALAIAANEQLEEVRLYNTNLKSLSVVILQSLSNISTLKYLNINNNQITKEAGEALASVIMYNTGLQELYLRNNNLGEGMLKVAKALQHITSLKLLNLGDNCISNEVSKELAVALKSSQNLEKLWLYDCNLKLSAIDILQSLSIISTLHLLNINDSQITEEAGEALASVIMCNTGLQELYLRNNNLGEGMLKVAKALQHITSLKLLNLGDNYISNEISKELAVALKSSQNLEKLWLYNCNLNFSAIDILRSLSTISTLQLLNMDNNQITKDASEALGSVVLHNTGLEELHLSGNSLGGGLLILIKALKHITSLTSIDMGNNFISKEVSGELALAIKCNKHLEKLWLTGVNLRSSMVIVLKVLWSISELKILDMCGNVITEEAGNVLVSVLSRNPKLQYLQFNLVISPLKVIEALRDLSTLSLLTFDASNITEEIEDKIAFVINNNKSLMRLSLENINLSKNVIFQSIATLSKLKSLWLGSSSLTVEMCSDLSLAIGKNKSLEKLNLNDNMLETGLIKVAEACNKLSNMQVLQLAHNCIIPSKVVELTSIITQNTSLETVLFGGITLNAAECFHYNTNEVLHKTSVISYNNTSQVISFDHGMCLEVMYLEMLRSQIVDDIKCMNDIPIYLNAKNFSFVQKVFHYFENNNIFLISTQEVKQKLAQLDDKKMISSLYILEKVKVIDLANNNIDEDASFELTTALHSNNVLEQLWLRGNKLNTAGALSILSSLRRLTTLQVLDLSYNNIGSQSADGIAAVIDNNPLMNQLWLDGNDLHSTGTITICNALRKIRRLSILSLCNNGITDDAADELSAVITQNILLEDLLLSNNQLHSTGIKIIAESLSKLIKLRKLDLFNNDIGKEGASSLAIVIQNSTSLQDLFLSSNNLETSGALEICNALSHINSLHVLTLSNNNISDEVTSQLIEVLNNSHLYALLIGGNGLECGGLKIAQVIENDNIAMQLLDFSNNNISEQDKENIKIVFSKRGNFQLYV